jgi:hypothetical protein
VGYLAPKQTMELLDLRPVGSSMGHSEIRAVSGALFIGLGSGAIFLAEPFAFAMLGFAWAGAAVGRLTSILADPAPTRRTHGFFATEAVVATLLLAINLG